jgi:hypothetical protein
MGLPDLKWLKPGADGSTMTRITESRTGSHVFLIVLLFAAALTGCGQSSDSGSNDQQAPSQATTNADPKPNPDSAPSRVGQQVTRPGLSFSFKLPVGFNLGTREGQAYEASAESHGVFRITTYGDNGGSIYVVNQKMPGFSGKSQAEFDRLVTTKILKGPSVKVSDHVTVDGHPATTFANGSGATTVFAVGDQVYMISYQFGNADPKATVERGYATAIKSFHLK